MRGTAAPAPGPRGSEGERAFCVRSLCASSAPLPAPPAVAGVGLRQRSPTARFAHCRALCPASGAKGLTEVRGFSGRAELFLLAYDKTTLCVRLCADALANLSSGKLCSKKASLFGVLQYR